MEKKEENYYDITSDFEPSIETKKYWLKTRKVKRQYGKVWFPGLFNTAKYKNDIFFFLFIVILEIVGLIFLGAAVRWNSIIFYGFAIAIFMDFVCVFWSHSFSGQVNENKNRIIIARYESDQDELNKLTWKNIWILIFTKYMAELVIFLIAIGKIYFYLDAKGGFDSIINPQTGSYDIKIFGIIIIYLLIFVLHISYTGFAIHGYRFRRKLNREYQRFLFDRNSHHTNDFPITTRFSENQINAFREFPLSQQLLQNFNINSIKELPKNAKQNFLEKNKNGIYTIHTWSVLKDDDLHSLSQMHQDTDKERLFMGIQGLKHQLALMVSNPKFI